MLMAALTVEFKELSMEYDVWYSARMMASFIFIRTKNLELYTTRQLSLEKFIFSVILFHYIFLGQRKAIIFLLAVTYYSTFLFGLLPALLYTNWEEK
jgi:hypothetical protein